MRQVKTHSFNGKRFTIKHCNLLRTAKCLGLAHFEKKTLYIPTDGDTQDELETIVHEACHGAFPFIAEEEITDGAEAIARLLWRLGWRRDT
jgi:hypothetical protein